MNADERTRLADMAANLLEPGSGITAQTRIVAEGCLALLGVVDKQQARIEDVERERDACKAELATSRDRITQLEALQQARTEAQKGTQ